jgi:FAD/FMN-containing dehydrogenase
VPGDRAFIDEVMGFCEASGIGYLNPHTFVLEESGLFADFDRIVAFKRTVDPAGLLNPGKIGQAFFAPASAAAGTTA